MSRVAIVTGAGTGIGRVVAQSLAADGHRCVLVGRTATTLKETATLCGDEAHIVIADVTAPDASDRIVFESVERFGSLDILVNNAGGGQLERFFDVTPEHWRAVLELNTTASFFLSRAALAVMKPAGWGRIVNVSSVYAHVVHNPHYYADLFNENDTQRHVNPTRNPAYSAAKAGLEGLTRELAVVAAPWGITVNAVAPGMIDTNRGLPTTVANTLSQATPVGRLGTPEEVAHVVSMLVSDLAGFMTGTVITVDGGWTLW